MLLQDDNATSNLILSYNSMFCFEVFSLIPQRIAIIYVFIKEGHICV